MNWPQVHKIRVQGRIRHLQCELNLFNYYHHLIINFAEPLILVRVTVAWSQSQHALGRKKEEFSTACKYFL